MKKIKLFLPLLILPIAIGTVGVQPVSAADASLTATPVYGNHELGDVFGVEIIADSNEGSFNVVQADVSVTNNLQIQNVILGDCNFSFVITPDISNPSFLGGILGGNAAHCTVETLLLKATAPGTGAVLLNNVKMKAYPTSEELNPTAIPGQYAIANTQSTQQSTYQSTPVPTTAPVDGTYTVAVTALSSDNKPLVGATVSMTTTTAAKPSQSAVQTAATDANGVATFPKVPQGAQQVVVKQNQLTVADKIVTINGKNGTIELGIQAKKNTNILPILATIMFLLVCIAAILVYRKPLLAKFKR